MFSFLKKTNPDTTAEKFDGGWFSRLKSGLARTGNQLTDLFSGGGKIDDDLYEELETILVTSDVGLNATQALLSDLRHQVSSPRDRQARGGGEAGRCADRRCPRARLEDRARLQLCRGAVPPPSRMGRPAGLIVGRSDPPRQWTGGSTAGTAATGATGSPGWRGGRAFSGTSSICIAGVGTASRLRTVTAMWPFSIVRSLKLAWSACAARACLRRSSAPGRWRWDG